MKDFFVVYEVTGAKKRMHIFSSMNAADILTTADSKKGLRALRAFLDYCEKGHLYQNIITHKAPDSDFEIAVMDALAQYGYQCEPQVGVNGFFIDIAVKNPHREGHFLLGIECDGATYHSAKSVRDRDRLRQEILENLGWEMYRIWSTDWFNNPDAALQPILQRLDALATQYAMLDGTDDDTDTAGQIPAAPADSGTPPENNGHPPYPDYGHA